MHSAGAWPCSLQCSVASADRAHAPIDRSVEASWGTAPGIERERVWLEVVMPRYRGKPRAT